MARVVVVITRRAAWFFWLLTIMFCAGLAFGQVGPETLTGGTRLAGMTASEFLGAALLASLGVLGLLVKFMSGQWMRQQQETMKVLTQVRDAIRRCPGIDPATVDGEVVR